MPSGFASLCHRRAGILRAARAAAPPLALLSVQLWDLLNSVNRTINHSIASTTDEKLYGRVEYWTLPKDCG